MIELEAWLKGLLEALSCNIGNSAVADKHHAVLASSIELLLI
jgi:hypothetical protein